MTSPLQTTFVDADPGGLAEIEGSIAVPIAPDGSMDALTRKLDRLTKKALSRLAASDAFGKAATGKAFALAWPAGVAAGQVVVVKLPRRPSDTDARRAGAAIAGHIGDKPLTILAGSLQKVPEVLLGMVLKAHVFNKYRTGDDGAVEELSVSVQVKDPKAAEQAFGPLRAQAEGVLSTRRLVSEPANVLTTTEFADRLKSLEDLGLEVEILEEDRLEELGMRALLAVGRGSETPTKVAVLRWNNGGKEAPLAVVGKGVVFDTGGISIKPSAGMEEMTMDMGGAAVVAGLMKTLALRKAPANVVGICGLVENMPDGKAQRPGDVVRSMKGDTIEVINTDAEGRLVLADAMWFAQEEFRPAAMIDLATLTGAVIIALGHENAGVFSNDDEFADGFLKAAATEDEGAWRMPLSPAYDELIKSRIADVANVGGRAAGSVTAAKFLQRFVQDGVPWIHLDIAGVAYTPKGTALAAKGATGWGVRTLDRLIRDRFENKE